MPGADGSQGIVTRVHFSNNYSTTLSERRCEAGTYPRQHLYGLEHLRAAGFEVEVREPESAAAWLRTSGRLGWRLGHLAQLPRAVQRGDATTVDVAVEPFHAALLAQGRGAGWRRQPLVVVFHAPMTEGAFSRRLVEGVDVAVCLSRRVQTQLVEVFGRSAESTPWAPWGPDLSFAGYRSTGESHVLSSGKTLRDQATLVRALEGTGIPAVVHGAEASTREVRAVNPSGHLDQGSGRRPQLAYESVLDDLRRAAVIAVPLAPHERVAGLSEVADALALGKPLVITRSPWLDIDVEEIGCGIVVEQGDVDGWRRALVDLWSDPDRRHAMGAKGRSFAQTHCHAGLFGQSLVAAVHQAARR